MMGQALYLYSNIRVPIFQFVHIYGHLLQLQGLFKGGFSTLLRECTGNSVFFMTYEFTRYRLLSALKYHEARKLLAEPWQKDLYGKSYSKIIVEGVVDVISGGSCLSLCSLLHNITLPFHSLLSALVSEFRFFHPMSQPIS